MKARRSMTIAETVKHFPGAHMLPDSCAMRPEPPPRSVIARRPPSTQKIRDEWYVGYACALASIWRNHHAGQDVRDAMRHDGITLEHLAGRGGREVRSRCDPRGTVQIMTAMLPSSTGPKFKVGDRVTIRDYGTFGDGHRDFTLTVTDVFPNYGGRGMHRYYGDTDRGPFGAYEPQIRGAAARRRRRSARRIWLNPRRRK